MIIRKKRINPNIFIIMNNLNNLLTPRKETREKWFIFSTEMSEKISKILSKDNIPTWASTDKFIAELIEKEVWDFVFIRSFWDEFIDQFRPPYHRGYVYFDGQKFFIKRWKIRYISGTPFRAMWSPDSEEEYVLWECDTDEFKKYVSDSFLVKE